MTRNQKRMMWMRTTLAAVFAAGGCLAQSAETPKLPERKFFRLDFVVKELDSGKVINTRTHTINMATSPRMVSIRSGNIVPAPARHPAPGPPNPPVDVGTNIDCIDLTMVQDRLSLFVSGEISSAVIEPDAPGPVIRRVRWNSWAIVQLGKPTVIFTSDDPATKRQLQLELKASPI